MIKSFCQRLIESCEKHSEQIGMRIVGDETEVHTFGTMLKEIRSIAYRLEMEGEEQSSFPLIHMAKSRQLPIFWKIPRPRSPFYPRI